MAGCLSPCLIRLGQRTLYAPTTEDFVTCAIFRRDAGAALWRSCPPQRHLGSRTGGRRCMPCGLPGVCADPGPPAEPAQRDEFTIKAEIAQGALVAVRPAASRRESATVALPSPFASGTPGSNSTAGNGRPAGGCMHPDGASPVPTML